MPFSPQSMVVCDGHPSKWTHIQWQLFEFWGGNVSRCEIKDEAHSCPREKFHIVVPFGKSLLSNDTDGVSNAELLSKSNRNLCLLRNRWYPGKGILIELKGLNDEE